MKNRKHDRIRALLQQALPPVGNNREPARDLWPELQGRIGRAHDSAPAPSAIFWFDWVLAGGVALVAIAFPASIPVLLYYL
jgi:hypothetical protein